MKKSNKENKIKSKSLFDDIDMSLNKDVKKRQSKTSEKSDKRIVKSVKKSSQALKETKKTTSKSIKKNDDNKFNIDTISRSSVACLDDTNNSAFAKNKKIVSKTSKRQSDSLEKSNRIAKVNSKPKENKSRNRKQSVTDKSVVKSEKQSDSRDKNKEPNKRNIKSESEVKSEKQRNIINITKTRLDKERKQYKKVGIGNSIQLNDKPKKTVDDSLVEIELSGEKILVSPWSIDSSNIYHPGLDSEFLVHRLIVRKEEDKKDDSLDRLNKQLKTKFKTWDEASEYQGKLTESILAEYADKFNWLILLQSRDMEKYSAKFKKKFAKKYALKVLIDAEKGES